MKTIFKPNTIKISGEGKYSFDNLNFLNINLENNFNNGILNLKLDLDYKKNIEIDFINYKKPEGSVANIFLILEKKKNNFTINELSFKEKNNSLKIQGLSFNNNKLLSFKKVEVITAKNDFRIEKDKKIKIKGTKFDATNLAKVFTKRNKENRFEKIDSDIEIDFKNINVPMSERLQNFKLIGEIKKGQFVKIS